MSWTSASNPIAQADIGRQACEDENAEPEVKNIEHDLPPCQRLDRAYGINFPFEKMGPDISFP
jgi:hypothetical protein